MIDWDELMRREGSAVWRTACRLLRNQADADECFQETFLAALELSNRQRAELAGAIAAARDHSSD